MFNPEGRKSNNMNVFARNLALKSLMDLILDGNTEIGAHVWR